MRKREGMFTRRVHLPKEMEINDNKAEGIANKVPNANAKRFLISTTLNVTG